MPQKKTTPGKVKEFVTSAGVHVIFKEKPKKTEAGIKALVASGKLPAALGENAIASIRRGSFD